MKTLKEIVIERLSQLALSPIEAATKAGMERTYIRDIVEDKKRSVRADKLNDLARALELDPSALSRGELLPIGGKSISHGLGLTTVPLLSTVSAGDLMRDDLNDEAIGHLTVSGLKDGDWLALKVAGDSMDRISPPDSIIYIDRSDKKLVANGCYVIADEDGNATYKRFRPDPMRFEPVSNNPSHETIYPDQEPLVIGRVKRTELDM